MNNLMKVMKKDGTIKEFDFKKIRIAIEKASNEVEKETISKETELEILKNIEKLNMEVIPSTEIDRIVIKSLNKEDKDIAKAYKKKSKTRSKIRSKNSDLMQSIAKLGVMTDRDNANVGNNFSSKLLRIASESNKRFNLNNMNEILADAHENGDVYTHDLDSLNLTTNCLHIPTKEILEHGFNTGYGQINPPKRIGSAAALSCILLQASQNDMFGGQSHPDFDNDMAVFVEPTRQEIRGDIIAKLKNILGENFITLPLMQERVEAETEKELNKEIHQAMQSIIYNLNSMHSRAGSQVPFSSVNIGLPRSEDAALVCKIFLEEYEKGLGKGEQPIFPNIIFRVKKDVNREKNDPYFYLYKLACRVTARRMNPTFMNIDADFNKEYYDKGYVPATMGCRTYLMKNVNGEPGCKGRGNIAPATINLPRIGIKAMLETDKKFKTEDKYSEEYIKETIKTFWILFDEKIELAKDNLLGRYDVLKKLKGRDMPFVIGQHLMKGSEEVGENDSIEPILKQGTWGIGFIGLAETLIALTGKHHGENENSRKLGLSIISHLREKCDEYTEKYKLNFSTYATPAEGLSGKFVVQDRLIYGKIAGVTDKDYYTNSFHIPVNFPISIKHKIDYEAPYHKLCNGGHISYIEIDDNPTEETIMDIINYAYKYTNISYMGINFHMRYCKHCGTQLHNHETKCPKCGSQDIQGISRVTGYLSLDERFGAGKAAERKDRISHMLNHKQY